MGKSLAVSLALSLLVLASPLLAQDDDAYQAFSPDQLDNLLAPIALYPDPLLAQVLVAATFPDQIDDAARFVRDDPNAADVDGQPWDVSVKAVAHYPEVLVMMADKLDWTTSVGQAYVNQSTDLMGSVQRLRAQARAEGNLATTPEMEVVDSGGEIELWPAQPQYLFVPEYDPAVVFFSRAPLFFGARFFIGAWLNYDFDWREHRVFYHGWEHGSGWVERSRPYIHVNNNYVNNNYRNVTIDRNVVRRRVNYPALNRYNDVHRRTNFDNLRGLNRSSINPPPLNRGITNPPPRDRAVTNPPLPRDRGNINNPPPAFNRGGNNPPPPPNPGTISNKIIQRNIDTNDPRLNESRGRVSRQPPAVHAPDTPAFTPAPGGFDPRQASKRGQGSRAQMKPPPPPPPPPPHPPAKKDDKRDERKHQ